MSNFGPAPSRMTAKISPSLLPRSHFASVRSDGCVSLGAIGPLPLASAPWQNRQFFVKAALPAATDSALDATGFFIFAASAFPCAIAGADQMVKTIGRDKNDTRRMRIGSFVGLEYTSPPCKTAG